MNEPIATTWIYVYTTESYKKKNYFKIGQTRKNAHDRIDEQDGTSNPEELIPLDYWESEGKTDKEFHAFLEKEGFLRLRKKREWFIIPGGMDQIKELWNKFTRGIPRKNKFQLRKEQQNCVDKALRYFASANRKGRRFLINAIMRFGKSFTVYEIIKGLHKLTANKNMNVLVLTWKPAIHDSWREDLMQHIEFAGWGWRHIGHPHNNVAGDPGKPTIKFVSVQMLLCGKERDADSIDSDPDNDELLTCSNIDKCKEIFETNWDLIVFDEVHYGERTKHTQGILKELNPHGDVPILYVSGTPYKLVASGQFDDSNSFVWTVVDEQETKRAAQKCGDGSYDKLPVLKVFLIELRGVNGLSDLIKLYSDDEGFRIEKMFATNDNGEFENEAHVRRFFGLIQGNSLLARGFSPYDMGPKQHVISKMLDHSLWFLPSVAAISALAKLLNDNEFFKEFDIMETSGKTCNVRGITDIKNRIKSNNEKGKKTIVLACERLKEGVTIPQLGAVFMLNGCRSPESYFQSIFRPKSPWDMKIDSVTGEAIEFKQECYVFDFNPSRYLYLCYELAYIESKHSNRPTEECLRRIIDNCPVLDNKGIAWKGAVEAALQLGLDKYPVARIANPYMIGDIDCCVAAALSDVKASTNGKLDFTMPINGAVNPGKVFEIQRDKGKDEGSEKNTKKEPNLDKHKVRSVLLRIPNFIFSSQDTEFHSCRDIIGSADRELFAEAVGVSVELFELLYSTGVLHNYHDHCIEEYTHSLKQIGV